MTLKTKTNVFFLLLLTSSATYSEVPGQNISYSKAKSKVISATQNINTYGALEAAKLILDNIKKFEQLKLMVYQAQNIDDVIDDVADGLYEISKTYEKVTYQKDNILLIHNKSLKTISNTDELIISYSIDSNNKEILSLQLEIDTLTETVGTEQNKTKKRKSEININSKKSIINSLKAKNKVWNNFRTAQEKLLAKLKNNSEIIDLFLFTLEKNSEVYKEAADVAMLRKSAKSMLSQLTMLNSADDVIKDIENNWLEINDLMNEISNSDFHIK